MTFDASMYKLASWVALLSFTLYNCYFMSKESYMSFIEKIENAYIVLGVQGYTFYEFIFYNQIYQAGAMYTQFQIVRRIVLERIDYLNTLPELKQQETEYVLWKHIGKYLKEFFKVRKNNWYHDYQYNFPDPEGA